MALDVTGLTTAIDNAFKTEWGRRKSGIPLPAAGQEDRQLLFAAVARGVLEYLEAHQNEVLESLTVQESAGVSKTWTITAADININL
jgi:hypothetical protein